MVLILAYVYFIKSDGDEESLVSSSPFAFDTGAVSPGEGAVLGQEFLTLLLNVKNIRLDDSIFTDPAFATLRDSSIVLIQDGNEGRPNPFAPIGSDNFGTSAVVLPGVTPTVPNATEGAAN